MSRIPRSVVALTVLALGSATMGGCSATGTRVEGGPAGRAAPGASSGIATETVSADLQGLVFSSEGWIYIVEQGAPRTLTNEPEARDLAWDRERTSITYLSESILYAVSPNDGQAVRIAELPLVETARLDSAGAEVWFSVIGDADAWLEVKDLATGMASRIVTPEQPSGDLDVDFENRQLVAVGAGQQPARLYLVQENGDTEVILESQALFDPRFSPDGRRVSVAGIDAEGSASLWIVDPQTGKIDVVDVGDTRPVTPAWSPDGHHLAFRDARTGIIMVADPIGLTSQETGLVADDGGIAW